MGEFLVRAVSCIAIVGCLIGYNQVADAEMVSRYTDGTYTGKAQGFGDMHLYYCF